MNTNSREDFLQIHSKTIAIMFGEKWPFKSDLSFCTGGDRTVEKKDLPITFWDVT